MHGEVSDSAGQGWAPPEAVQSKSPTMKPKIGGTAPLIGRMLASRMCSRYRLVLMLPGSAFP